MSRPLIIIVEDDQVIAELLEFNLQNEGYATQAFQNGMDLFLALESQPELVVGLFILDIMLPGMDGFEICSRLKRNSRFDLSPVLMLTARGAEQDKVKGLETGADDYLTKPFGMREFLARVQALIRRYHKISRVRNLSAEGSADLALPSGGFQPPDGDEAGRLSRIACQNIVLDDARHRVYRDGVEVDLANREYELLKFLMLHRGIAYTRDDLLNYVWGYDYSGETRTVDVHIRQLRRKLEQDASNPKLIETVRGRGYRFCED